MLQINISRRVANKPVKYLKYLPEITVHILTAKSVPSVILVEYPTVIGDHLIQFNLKDAGKQQGRAILLNDIARPTPHGRKMWQFKIYISNRKNCLDIGPTNYF